MADAAPVLVYVALQDWFSSVRLPRRLREAGFRVVVLCTPESPLRFANSPDDCIVVAARDAAAALDAAYARHRPWLIVPADEAAVHALNHMARGAGVSADLAGALVAWGGRPACDGAGDK